MKLLHKKTRAQKKNSPGFSLAEISIVIAIISVVLGSAISVVITQDESIRISQSEKKIERISEALAAFLAVNHRLPCPAQATDALAAGSFGAESLVDANPDTCSSNTHSFTSANLYFGMVPVSTLGMPNSYAVDGWDRRFMYITDLKSINDHISTYASCSSANKDCFVHMDGGRIAVKPNSGGADIVADAVVAIISFGENGHGAYVKNGGATRYNAYKAAGATVDTDERENSFFSAGEVTDTQPTNLNATIIRKDRTATFDDIVWYATKQSLVRLAGAEFYGSDCIVAKDVIDNDPDDCTNASNVNSCRSFATEIWGRCLQ